VNAGQIEATTLVTSLLTMFSAVFPTISYVKDRSAEQVNSLVQEDEFRTSLRKLEAAYRAEELEPFAEALKVEPSGGLASFIKALQNQAKNRELDISEAMDED
jgi:hypothetical protein